MLFVGALLFSIMFWTGFVQIATALASGLVFDFHGFGKALWSIVGPILALAGLALAAWMFLLGIGTFVLLRAAYPITGLLGRSLFQTFLQTPAESPWAGHGKNERLVRLKVPPGMTTLGIAPGVDVQKALRDARDATCASLGDLAATSGAG
jgi:hypothetical protein